MHSVKKLAEIDAILIRFRWTLAEIKTKTLEVVGRCRRRRSSLSDLL